MSDKAVYIFGYSGHSFVIIDSLISNRMNVLGYYERQSSELNPYQLNYMDSEEDLQLLKIIGQNMVFPSIGKNQIREKLIAMFTLNSLHQTKIIDPSANVSETASIGLSTYIGKNTCINSLANIGNGVIINTSAVIEHECVIHDFSHVAPGAILAGGVTIGKKVFFGAGSVAKEGVKVGDNCIIGAGSVVLQNIPKNEVWAGCPARKIRNV